MKIKETNWLIDFVETPPTDNEIEYILNILKNAFEEDIYIDRYIKQKAFPMCFVFYKSFDRRRQVFGSADPKFEIMFSSDCDEHYTKYTPKDFIKEFRVTGELDEEIDKLKFL